jgi:hypothetical protein
MGEILGKAKVNWSEFHPQLNNASMDWEKEEYKECSEDWRHRDRLIWATLPVAATVGAVTVGVAYGQIPYCKPEVRFFLLLIGVVLAFVMLISLIKHRFYQQGSEQQIWSLQVRLNKKDWDKSPRKHHARYLELWAKTPSQKIAAKFMRWARRRSGFKLMLGGTLVVMLILAGLAIHTMVQWILN